jgi:hypothetical protein
MAEQAAVKSVAPYVSENPESDFQRFKDTLRRVVSVPKESVDRAMAEEAEQKRQSKEKAK